MKLFLVFTCPCNVILYQAKTFFLILGARQSRLQQLIDWCGGEHFDGCLIFDECHKAKHFVPVSVK